MYKLGIYGSASNNSAKLINMATQLGQVIDPKQWIIVNGACNGLPYEVAKVMAKNKGEVWGFTPLKNEEEILKTGQDISIYSKIIYPPDEIEDDILFRRKYRNILSTNTCDAAIIISGRWGTLNEFTNLVDLGKVIGVLTNTDGIADELPKLYEKISKQKNSGETVIFDNDPDELIKKILNILTK